VRLAELPVSSCRLLGFVGREVHRAPRHDGGDGVLVDHLRHRVAQEHHVLVERLDLPLQLDAVDQVDRHGHVLATQGVEERVLKRAGLLGRQVGLHCASLTLARRGRGDSGERRPLGDGSTDSC
jgi:hypothetical protein